MAWNTNIHDRTDLFYFYLFPFIWEYKNQIIWNEIILIEKNKKIIETCKLISKLPLCKVPFKLTSIIQKDFENVSF